MSLLLLLTLTFAAPSVFAAPVGDFVIENATDWEVFTSSASVQPNIGDSIWKEASTVVGRDISVGQNEEDPMEILIKANKENKNLVLGCQPADQSRSVRQQNLWPEGTIPFLVSDKIDAADRKMLADAMVYLQNRTCIQFVENINKKRDDYVLIQSEDKGCWSSIGRDGGEQKLNLYRGEDTTCWRLGIVIHELMHTIGFYHEHSRNDRDQFVSIAMKNIQPKDHCTSQYQKGGDDMKVIGEYDYCSIMHYPSKSSFCSVDENVPIITALKEPIAINTKCMGNRGSPTEKDIRKINEAYKCKDIEPADWVVKYGLRFHPASPLVTNERRIYGISLDQGDILEARSCSSGSCSSFTHRGPETTTSSNGNVPKERIYCLAYVKGAGVFIVTSTGTVHQAEVDDTEWTWVEHKRPQGLKSLASQGCQAVGNDFVMKGTMSSGKQGYFTLHQDDTGEWNWSEGKEGEPGLTSGITSSLSGSNVCLKVSGTQNCFPTGGIFVTGKVKSVSNPIAVPKWAKMEAGYYIFVSGITKAKSLACLYALHVNFEWKQTWKSIRCSGDNKDGFRSILPIIQPARDGIKIFTVDPMNNNLIEGIYPGKRFK